MKKTLSLLMLLSFILITNTTQAYVSVKGYYRSNGTYVAPYTRSSPNSTRLDNYSTRGNYNPYTGKAGTRNPYR